MSSDCAVPFELACNYWPRRSAMHLWREFDRGEIRADCAHMRDIGFRAVRFFLLTEDFLTAPMTVAPARVIELVEFVRIASEEGLVSIPTLITINMSGKLWWPAWMLDARGLPRDLYADPTLLRSQSRLVEICAGALAGSQAIRAFDLTNEIDDALRLPSRDAGWLWTALLAAAARRAAPGIPLQFGAHLPSLTADTHMRIDDLATIVDEDCMHAYPLYCDVARDFLDPVLVPFSLPRMTCGRLGPCRAHLRPKGSQNLCRSLGRDCVATVWTVPSGGRRTGTARVRPVPDPDGPVSTARTGVDLV